MEPSTQNHPQTLEGEGGNETKEEECMKKGTQEGRKEELNNERKLRGWFTGWINE